MKKFITFFAIATFIITSCGNKDNIAEEMKMEIEAHLKVCVLPPMSSNIKIQSIKYTPLDTIYAADSKYLEIMRAKEILDEDWMIKIYDDGLTDYLNSFYGRYESNGFVKEPEAGYVVSVEYSYKNPYGVTLEDSIYLDIVRFKYTYSSGTIKYMYESHNADYLTALEYLLKAGLI